MIEETFHWLFETTSKTGDMSTSPSPGGVIASKDRRSFSCQWADAGKDMFKGSPKKMLDKLANFRMLNEV